mgnify:CR=1 FL=1
MSASELLKGHSNGSETLAQPVSTVNVVSIGQQLRKNTNRVRPQCKEYYSVQLAEFPHYCPRTQKMRWQCFQHRPQRSEHMLQWVRDPLQ